MQPVNAINLLNSEIKKHGSILIEQELDKFFRACVKSAYAYSHMIVKDFKSHSPANFAQIVVSGEEIQDLLAHLVEKLNAELKKSYPGVSLAKDPVNQADIDISQLDSSLESFQLTQQITKKCESIIDGLVLQMFQVKANYVLDYLIARARPGEKILGENSCNNQQKKQQEKIFGQLEGLLINIKTNLKNTLIELMLQSLAGKQPIDEVLDSQIA
jgi:hypothetical protein